MKIINAQLTFRGQLTPLDLQDIEFITIHHMAAKTATVSEIHQWHLHKGWWGFGYNEYIRKNGDVYIGRGDNVGAHTAGYNDNGYGIGVEGDYNVETKMPKAQFDSLVERVKHHQNRLPRKPRVLPHSQCTPTDCPGKNFPMIELYEAISTRNEEPAWKFEGIEKLARMGLLNTPDEWIKKINEPMPVWACMLILSRIAERG